MSVPSWLTGRAGLRRHPSDEDLIMLALAGIHAADVLVAVHARECAACAERLVRLEAALGAERDRMTAEADRLLTQARLDEQRAAILRRIGGSRAGARVLAFPRHAVVEAPRRREAIRRSVAAAAVAGLLVGAFAGRVFNPSLVGPGRDGVDASRVTLDREAGLEARQVAVAADEAFLRDFETAVGAHRVEAIRTLDELTPLPVDLVAAR